MSRRALDRDILLAESARKPDTLNAGRRLVEELPGGHRALGLLVALTLGEVLSQVVVVLAARQVLTAVTAGESSFPVAPTVIAVIAALATFLVVRARHRLQERLAVGARERAVARLALHLHRADFEDLSATPMAGLREVLMTDIDFAYRFLLDSVSQLTVLAAWLVAALAITAWLSLPLLGALVVLGVVVAAAMVQATRRHLALTAQRFARLAAVSQRARDVVEVERVVVARQFGLRDLFVRRFLDSHADFAVIAAAQGRVNASMRAAVASLGSASFLVVVVVGSALVLDDALSVGSLVAVLFVMAQLLAAVAALGDFAARLAETSTAGRRLMAFWDEDTQPPEPPARREGDAVSAVMATGLGFGYGEDPPVLDGVEVTLRRGRPAALTAATGAGKSTLALLLTGVLTPSRGHVELHTEDGRTLAPDAIHPGRMLYVGSKPVLVAGSVLDNLLLDRTPPDLDEIRRFVTAVTAGVLPFDVDAPVVGPNGTGLSSGQAQLVQLTRAVYRDPDVIILDEATSALDIETEVAVQEGLLDWCAARTTLVVSHRTCPWTERAVDRIGLVRAPGRAR